MLSSSPLPEARGDTLSSLPRRHSTSIRQTVSHGDSSLSPGQNEAYAPPIIPSEDRNPHLEDTPSQSGPPLARRTEVRDLITLHAYLTLFSILGTLARLGLIALTTYPGTPLGGVIWANFTGCVVMGFLVEDRKVFCPPEREEKGVVKKGKSALPLYLGLTTGFCGSLTSFSSFMLVIFENLANVEPAFTRPTKGYHFMAALAEVIGTIALSISGLRFGAHLSLLTQPILPSIPVSLHRVLDVAILPLGVGAWAATAIMTALIPKWRGIVMFATVFSPIGVFGRFWASRLFNSRVKRFPMGTFGVNIIGTVVLAGATIGRADVSEKLGCQVLRGIADGFCGCLTTVSTFVVEVGGLRRRHAYIYALSSIAAGMCAMILVLGSYTWTHDLQTGVC